jgi:galactokinase
MGSPLTPFETLFGYTPQATAIAPGRVNLLGEHTDYNQGFVLPTILPLQTTVHCAIAVDHLGKVDIFSATLEERVERDLNDVTQAHWSDYILACLQQLQQRNIAIPGLKLWIESTIPLGAGVSSSAALEVAILKSVRSLLNLPLSEIDIAQIAQQAEHQGVGVPCGIMDQLVSAIGQLHQALFLDTRSLTFSHVPLPFNDRFAVVHSGKTRSLSDSGYSQRRQDCKAAAIALNVGSLRELTVADLETLPSLPNPLARRVRHVITENQRVLDGVDALQSGEIARFGELMNQSQRSQREDFAVTVPETEQLCAIALAEGAWGARQTGGGFGGAIVALVPEVIVQHWWQQVSIQCPTAQLLCIV